VTVLPGATYTFSFYARSNGGPAASYAVFDLTGHRDIIEPTPYVARLGIEWTQIVVTFTTPAGCTSAGVYPLRDSAGAVDLFLWGAKLELGTSATPY
jgi:hypothetical protein